MNRKNESGSTVVEFCFALLILCTFMFGIVDFSRMLFMWSAANEAARAGARYAVVCGDGANTPAVLAKMQGLLPQIATINLAWSPNSCTTATCEGVTVTITGLNFQWISPIVGVASFAAIPMPSFSTYLPREIMRQDSHSGTIC